LLDTELLDTELLDTELLDTELLDTEIVSSFEEHDVSVSNCLISVLVLVFGIEFIND
jgi:hypothetical protein